MQFYQNITLSHLHPSYHRASLLSTWPDYQYVDKRCTCTQRFHCEFLTIKLACLPICEQCSVQTKITMTQRLLVRFLLQSMKNVEKRKKRQKVKKRYTRKIAGTVPPIVIDPWVPKKCLVINNCYH